MAFMVCYFTSNNWETWMEMSIAPYLLYKVKFTCSGLAIGKSNMYFTKYLRLTLKFGCICASKSKWGLAPLECNGTDLQLFYEKAKIEDMIYFKIHRPLFRSNFLNCMWMGYEYDWCSCLQFLMAALFLFPNPSHLTP